MIMQYICVYFHQLVFDKQIGLIKYEQFILILKNKYVSVRNEDLVICGLENWLAYNT